MRKWRLQEGKQTQRHRVAGPGDTGGGDRDWLWWGPPEPRLVVLRIHKGWFPTVNR